MTTHEVVLHGCHPSPLAHYLKALGVLRLVGEQVDPDARGAWVDDAFRVWSTSNREGFVWFFVHDYRPTPIIAPWNGGSGFHPKDNTSGIEPIETSKGARWSAYRETIAVARKALAQLGMTGKPEKDDKTRLLALLRGALPDDALAWMDAALLLTDGSDKLPDGLAYGAQPKYPPLLGTGGNDGRLDFTNNFMQRLVELLDPVSDEPPPSSASLLEQALFGEAVDSLRKGAAIGQFLPGDAGGANAEAGFDADSLINPWDFVLMLEGAAMFASAAVRRHESDIPGAMSYPFTVHGVGAGYGSAAQSDEADSRAEMWLPLWSNPAHHREVEAMLAEGRARVGRRSARTGVDFARAAVSLGVDRGISAFERVGFQVRNGLSYLATPLGRIEVQSSPTGDPVAEIDDWLDSFRRAASDNHAPAGAARALRGLEAAIFELCRRPTDGDRTLDVLVALGQCEAAMVKSLRWTVDKRLRPIPRLNPRRWLTRIENVSELRLALSLASVSMKSRASTGTSRYPLRDQIEPVSGGRFPEWNPQAGRDVAWKDGDTISGLIAVLGRRLLVAREAGYDFYPDRGRLGASLADITGFIDRDVDDTRLAALTWAGALFDWSRRDLPTVRAPDSNSAPPALYGLLKLCFAGECLDGWILGDRGSNVEVPMVPAIVRHAAVGDSPRASELALRRLRGSGLAPAVGRIATGRAGGLSRRIAAALAFPLARAELRRLASLMLRPQEQLHEIGEATPSP